MWKCRNQGCSLADKSVSSVVKFLVCEDECLVLMGSFKSLQKTKLLMIKESPQKIPDRLQERIGELNADERLHIAKLTGYRQIGIPLPEETSVLDVIRTFPPEV